MPVLVRISAQTFSLVYLKCVAMHELLARQNSESGFNLNVNIWMNYNSHDAIDINL